MWQDLIAAVALVLVLEGILPFLNPTRFKQNMAMMMQMNESTLRGVGLASMVVGLILLYLVR